jgi:hypothetical protein
MKEIFDKQINWNTKIWKYFRTERFMESMSGDYLYFSAAFQFEDLFEGAVAIQSPEYKTDPRYDEYEDAEDAFNELKRLTKISCWHEFDYENDAMWKLYAESRKGIAVYTTPKKLKEYIEPFRLKPEYGIEELHIGNVKYLDLGTNRLNVSMLERFFYKHIVFKWENELRLAISLRMAEENGVTIPENGIKVTINLKEAIEGIIIGPNVQESDRNMIQEACEKSKIKNKIEYHILITSQGLFKGVCASPSRRSAQNYSM